MNTTTDLDALIVRLQFVEHRSEDRCNIMDWDDARDAREAIARLRAENERMRPWFLFYAEGKTLGEVAEACGGTIYKYSPWLTAPLVRNALADAGKIEAAESRATAAEAEVERLKSALEDIADHPGPNACDAAHFKADRARAALNPNPKD